MPTTHIWRANWVLPISSGPIEQGEVVFQEDRILEVRSRPVDGYSRDDVAELGDAILLPGLVNVHSHIDYTVMRGLIEDVAFFPWIRELTARKAALEEPDWIASATLGAMEAVAGGVTTLGDCTDSGAAMLGMKALGLRGTVYQEVFGIDETRSVADIVAELDLKIRALGWQASGTRIRVGVSPHSPYTVREALGRELAAFAASANLPVCIHASESQAEAELIWTGTGGIRTAFDGRSIPWRGRGITSVEFLGSQGLLSSRTLLVHGVQVSRGDARLVSESGAAWAHCPKSNAKLGNGIVPLPLLRGEGNETPVGLGSDSVASNNTMDLFEEMRFAVLAQRASRRTHEALTGSEALAMATIGGARALGLEASIGSLEPGKQADFAVVGTDRLLGGPSHNPVSALVYSASARDVRTTVIGGETVYERGRFARLDPASVAEALHLAAKKVRAWPDAPRTEA